MPRIFDNKPRGYVIDASSLESDNFYPVILRIYAGEDGNPQELFDYTGQLGVSCEIASADMTNFGPNFIKFYAKCDGDSKVPETISVKDYGTYNKNQITIGCIGFGKEEGNICVWVRGGTKYSFNLNAVPTLYPIGYTSDGGEKFTFGTNLSGGTNENIDIAYTPTGEPPKPTTVILYNTTGQNTDGAMTQKATTDELNSKVKDIKVNGTIQPKVDGVVDLTISGAVSSVNGKTGAVVLNASDVHALPDTTLIPTKTSDLTNDSSFVSDANYIHTDNNYTTTEKTKLSGLENYDDTEIKQDIADLDENKADKTEIPIVGNGTITIKQGGTTKGTFTTNQSGNAEIELDAGGGSGDVADVYVDGESVLGENKIAQIDLTGKENKHWVGTRAELDALPLEEDKVYETTDDNGGESGGVSDVQINGVSVVDENKVANISTDFISDFFSIGDFYYGTAWAGQVIATKTYSVQKNSKYLVMFNSTLLINNAWGGGDRNVTLAKHGTGDFTLQANGVYYVGAVGTPTAITGVLEVGDTASVSLDISLSAQVVGAYGMTGCSMILQKII